MPRHLLDTCVLTDYFRGDADAVAFLGTLEEPPFISALTVAELYAGVREGKERRAVEALLEHLPTIPLDAEMAAKGGLYKRQYGKAHGVGIVDALLAACAELKGLSLVTKNRTHFPMLEEVVGY